MTAKVQLNSGYIELYLVPVDPAVGRQKSAISALNRGTYHSMTVMAPPGFGHSLEPKTAFPQHIKTL